MIDLNKYSADFDPRSLSVSPGGSGEFSSSLPSGNFEDRNLRAFSDRTVKGYGHSRLGSQRATVATKRYAPPSDSDAAATQSNRQAFNAGHNLPERGGLSGRQAENAKSSVSAGLRFKEPASRNYNPYS